MELELFFSRISAANQRVGGKLLFAKNCQGTEERIAYSYPFDLSQRKLHLFPFLFLLSPVEVVAEGRDYSG